MTDPINHLHETEARWFAVRTEFKREKRVRKFLTAQGIENFLPTVHKVRHYTRKTRHVELPLINNYIFVKITRPQYVPVLRTMDVLYFIKLHKDLISIPEAEIDTLKRVIGAKVEVTIRTGEIEPGDRVRVVAGNLAGLEGVFVGTVNSHSFLVELKTLGQYLAIQIDPAQLDRLDPKG